MVKIVKERKDRSYKVGRDRFKMIQVRILRIVIIIKPPNRQIKLDISEKKSADRNLALKRLMRTQHKKDKCGKCRRG